MTREQALDTLIALKHFPPRREDEVQWEVHRFLERQAQAVLRRAAFCLVPGRECPDGCCEEAEGR